MVTVIIATAFGRTKMLLDRSIRSVYLQENVNPSEVRIIVVDDNAEIDNEAEKIREGIQGLREAIGLEEWDFRTSVLSNCRTKGNSGTGAWNTGINLALEEEPEGYVSILDDDDAYLSDHLFQCLEAVTRNPGTVAVFQDVIWRNVDGSEMRFPLDAACMQPRAFFIGNPGVQGSNLFFKTKALIAAGSFDERFPNTTDRDLMIRFLWYVERTFGIDGLRSKITITGNLGVIHHHHDGPKVSSDNRRKDQGLDLFFATYKDHFSEEDYQASLRRAEFLFSYQPVHHG
jgi:glycosyltransferase involved in cell wall biosynthesis